MLPLYSHIGLLKLRVDRGAHCTGSTNVIQDGIINALNHEEVANESAELLHLCFLGEVEQLSI